MTTVIEANGKVTLQIGTGNRIEAVYNNNKLSLHSKGGYSRRFNTEISDIYFTSPFNKPPGNHSGWTPYAADVRGGEGIFIWTSYRTDEGSPDNVYQVLGFSLRTGAITKYYKDDGSTLDIQTMLQWEAELDDPTSAYDPTSLYFGRYGSRGEELGNEIADMHRLFDDIINPNANDANPPTAKPVISAPSAYDEDNADIISNYIPKANSAIQIEISSFDGAVGKLKIAKKSKKVARLAKKDIDFIYDQQAGYLYYNENGKQPGFGDGGIFAILEGKPKAGLGNFEFV